MDLNFTELKQNPYFDWMRFLAAMAVLLNHTRNSLFVEYSQLEVTSKGFITAVWFALSRLGYEAVIVFFVLSGFLVGRPAVVRALSGKFEIKEYFLDRGVRILIPLFPAIILTAFSGFIIAHPMSLPQFLGVIFSLQGVLTAVPMNNGALWTLTYEVWFYILGGCIAFYIAACIPSRFPNLIPLALIVLAIGVFSQLNALYVLIWFSGAFAYIFRPRIINWKVLVFGVFLIVIAIAIHQLSLPNTLIENTKLGFEQGIVISEIILSLGVGLLISNLANLTSSESSKFVRWGRLLGGFSYSLYLIHLPLLYLQSVQGQTAVTPKTFIHYCLTILVIMLMAFFYAKLFEANGGIIKKYLRRKFLKGENAVS